MKLLLLIILFILSPLAKADEPIRITASASASATIVGIDQMTFIKIEKDTISYSYGRYITDTITKDKHIIVVNNE